MRNVPSWPSITSGFNVHVTAPYIETFDGEEVTFTALIRDCDSGAGMIIDPDWSTLKRYTDEISSAGLGYSCVELAGIDREGMAKILSDWFGVARVGGVSTSKKFL